MFCHYGLRANLHQPYLKEQKNLQEWLLMRKRLDRVRCVSYYTGSLMKILALVVVAPLVVVAVYWGEYGDGMRSVFAFLIPAALSFATGAVLQAVGKQREMDPTASMLVCAVGWLAVSAIGALPFVLGIEAAYLDGYFEAMSGFTTTGITVFTGLEQMPRSILFWRAVTQFVGGLGILSFFLAVTYRGGGAHHLFGAEGHKIASSRPAPGLLHTLKILWSIYLSLVTLCALLLSLLGMPVFDSICHAFTALSTGGFSPHDASIQHYRDAGYRLYWLMEYTLTLFMLFGGMNFLIHFRVVSRDFKALWDNLEIRWLWGILGIALLLVMGDHIHRNAGFGWTFGELEECFRLSIFQIVSILTTTGFGTQDIGSAWFPTLSKQIFLVLMVVGGCVGSTGGGIKVMRIAILNRLIMLELFKLRAPRRAISLLVIDGKIVPDDEIRRVGALFFTWMALLLTGGGITAFLSDQSAWQSFSGMFSALGNIGPCYISVADMCVIHPIVKLTYVFGMLAGRLEILPVLLLFSRRAWTD